MTDDEMTQAMVREMATMGGCEFHFSPTSMLRAVGLFQLVNRHPNLSEDHREFVRRFVEKARSYFAHCPAVLETISRGDDPGEDTKTLTIQCPLCEWSARNEIEGDPAAEERVNEHLRRAFVGHVEREHTRVSVSSSRPS